MPGDLDRNWMLPTAVGAIRPACLAPSTIIAGDVRQPGKRLIVGFKQFLDFYPTLVAANLNAQNVPAEAVMLDLPALREWRFVNGMALARLFDTPEFRAEVIEAIRPSLGDAQRVGFPAVLGLHRASEVQHDLEAGLGLPAFEIPGLPPSIPGIRLFNLLVDTLGKSGTPVLEGMQVTTAMSEGNIMTGVTTEAAARSLTHGARNFVLATGGILGGGIVATSTGYAQESALGLTVPTPGQRPDWFRTKFLAPEGHPIFQSGIIVNDQFQPVDEDSQPPFANLFAIGGALGNCDPIRERSLEGIALATGYRVGENLSR
jgi:glycerol-3-phosphate dehydrogenase subunit B